MQREVQTIQENQIKPAISFIQHKSGKSIHAIDLHFKYKKKGNELATVNFLDKDSNILARYVSKSVLDLFFEPDVKFEIQLPSGFRLKYIFNKVGVDVIKRFENHASNLDSNNMTSELARLFISEMKVHLMFGCHNLFGSREPIMFYNLNSTSSPSDCEYRMECAIRLLDNIEAYYQKKSPEFSRKLIAVDDIYEYIRELKYTLQSNETENHTTSNV